MPQHPHCLPASAVLLFRCLVPPAALPPPLHCHRLLAQWAADLRLASALCQVALCAGLQKNKLSNIKQQERSCEPKCVQYIINAMAFLVKVGLRQ